VDNLVETKFKLNFGNATFLAIFDQP